MAEPRTRVCAALPAMALAACSGADERYSYTPDPSRQYPPVTAANAPTIAQLKSRGLEHSGMDSEDFACGPSCDAVHVYTIFMGRAPSHPRPALHFYTCPNPKTAADFDQWRCAESRGVWEARNG